MYAARITGEPEKFLHIRVPSQFTRHCRRRCRRRRRRRHNTRINCAINDVRGWRYVKRPRPPPPSPHRVRGRGCCAYLYIKTIRNDRCYSNFWKTIGFLKNLILLLQSDRIFENTAPLQTRSNSLWVPNEQLIRWHDNYTDIESFEDKFNYHLYLLLIQWPCILMN